MPRSRRWILLAGGGLVVLTAALLTRFDLRLARSEAVTLVAAEAAKAIPSDDPYASAWDRVAPLEIPLSAQDVAAPMGGGSVRAVTARALHDGRRLYILLDWADSTQDESSATGFRDAAAVQFPARGVKSLPSFCMGMGGKGALVNIWHWKADWQADVDRGYPSIDEIYPRTQVDLYPFKDEDTFYPARALGNPAALTDRPSPIENMFATGFGTLATADSQPVTGVGRWRDGRWRVLFVRDLSVEGDDARFSPGKSTSIAFAVWDGAKNEASGEKSVSQFAALEIAGRSVGGGLTTGAWIAIVGPVVALLAAASATGWLVLRRHKEEAT